MLVIRPNSPRERQDGLICSRGSVRAATYLPDWRRAEARRQEPKAYLMTMWGGPLLINIHPLFVYFQKKNRE